MRPEWPKEGQGKPSTGPGKAQQAPARPWECPGQALASLQAPKAAPSGLKRAHESDDNNTRTLQYESKRAPYTSEETREFEECPRDPQEGPNIRPNWCQNVAKRAQETFQVVIKARRRPKRAPRRPKMDSRWPKRPPRRSERATKMTSARAPRGNIIDHRKKLNEFSVLASSDL